MAIQVTRNYKVSTSFDLVARTSQCVAIGLVDSTQDICGIAHIHSNNAYELFLMQ